MNVLLLLAAAESGDSSLLKAVFDQVANVRTPLTLAAFVVAVFLAVLYRSASRGGKKAAQMIIIFFFVLSLVAIVLGVLAWAFAVGRESQGLFVSGAVQDAESKAPIIGATIAILNARSGQDQSSNNGSFSIAYLPFKRGDTLTVRAVADGYEPKAQDIKLEAASAQANFELARIHRPLKGRVEDTQGAAIVGAHVFADSGESTLTGQNGEFTLSIKQPVGGSNVTIHVQATGFQEWDNVTNVETEQYLSIKLQH